MKIDISDGVRIEGVEAELLDLAESLVEASSAGLGCGVILTEDGVTEVTVLCTDAPE